MADIAQILGVPTAAGGSSSSVPPPPPSQPSATGNNNKKSRGRKKKEPPPSFSSSQSQPSRAMELQGMPREVMHLLSGAAAGKQQQQQQQQPSTTSTATELPTSVPTFTGVAVAGGAGSAQILAKKNQDGAVKVGNKWIFKNKPARKWAWAPFSSSSRTDGELFYHWVRANVEYPDYPYARFDIHMDPVAYTDEEYNGGSNSNASSSVSSSRRPTPGSTMQLSDPSSDWTKAETDQLMELCRIYELRWPVIHDRWVEMFQNSSASSTNNKGKMRNVEDLQYRYYTIAAKLAQSRISHEATAEVQALVAAASAAPSPTNVSATASTATVGAGAATINATEESKAAADSLVMETAAARALASCDPDQQPLIAHLGTGSSNKTFDFEYEKGRRLHLNALWERSKDDELEELELRKELKAIEASLRKLKKSGGHIVAAASSATTTGAAGGSFISSAVSSRNVSPVAATLTATAASATLDATEALLDRAWLSTAPTPVPQTPYLQSGRLTPPSTSGPNAIINKTMLSRMETVLKELNIPPSSRLTPTKRVCDLYDRVRKDILALLVLQKNAEQKEGWLQSKRLQLAKMGGNIKVVDEETLLGIAPPPAPDTALPGSATKAAGAAAAKASSASSTAAGGMGRGKGGKGVKGKGKSAGSGSGTTKGGKKKGGGDGSVVGAGTAAAAATLKQAAQAVASKDAPPTSAVATTTSGKPGGKQPRKASVKRKRKSDKSPGPPSGAAASAAGATTSAMAAATPSSSTTAAASKPEEGGKQVKKRRKKEVSS